jgi:hypothetical protein
VYLVIDSMRFVLLTVLLVAATGAAAAEVHRLEDVDDVYPPAISWEGKRVLHIGDSHVSAGLVAGLRKRIKAEGARYRPITWVGSRSKSWVVSGRLRRLLRKHAPHVVIVTLGTNVIKGRHQEHNAPWIRALVRMIGPRECFWLGPPPLIKDRFGFNEMAESACKPCRYFDTRVLDFRKRKDGKFHLSRKQGRTWAAQAWMWINGDWPPPPEEDAL